MIVHNAIIQDNRENSQGCRIIRINYTAIVSREIQYQMGKITTCS